MAESGKIPQGRYEQIEREAYERYLLEVAQGWAAEEERLEDWAKGTSPPWLVREVVLIFAGTKNAALEFRTYNPRSDREFTTSLPIYAEPFEDKEGKRTANLRRALGDEMMHLLGG